MFTFIAQLLIAANVLDSFFLWIEFISHICDKKNRLSLLIRLKSDYFEQMIKQIIMVILLRRIRHCILTNDEEYKNKKIF